MTAEERLDEIRRAHRALKARCDGRSWETYAYMRALERFFVHVDRVLDDEFIRELEHAG